MEEQPQIITIGDTSRKSQTDHAYQLEDVIAERFKVNARQENSDFIQSFLCDDLQTGKQIVLYVLPSAIETNGAVIEELEKCVEKLKELHHEHVLSDYQFVNEAEGKRFIVFNYPQGPNLMDFVKRLDLSVEGDRQRVYSILLQIAMALDNLHSEGIMQGDLYPENIIITKNDHAVLINTGMTIILRNSQKGRSDKNILDKNHLQFQSPELWEGSEITMSSEQYAFGVMVYELLAGKLPFDEIRPDLLKKIVMTQDADLPAGATPREAKGIMRAMSKQPDMRFLSNQKFIKSLIPFKLTNAQKKGLIGIVAAIVIAIIGLAIHFYQVTQQEMNVKAQQEAVARQEREKQEQESSRKINEVGQLQWKAKELLEEMRRRQYHTEQTFGKHIEAAEQLYKEGLEALGSQDKLAAYDRFKKSIENCEWLRVNEEMRETVKIKLAEIRQLHENDKHDARHLFPDQWKNAEESLTNAGQHYEDGEFEKALLMLKQASDDFSKANQNAKDYILNQYKNLAESAIMKKDWLLLSDYAKKLSEINSEQGEHYLKIATTNINIETLQRKIKEAQSSFEKKLWNETINRCKEIQDMLKNEPELKKQFDKETLDNILEMFDMATMEVTSNLKIKAMIGDEEVNVDINGLEVAVKSNNILKQLELNKAYTLELSYIHQRERYEGNCVFTVDWIGVKELTVEMRKSVDILLEKVQDLTEKKKWEDVLITCQCILELDKENQKALKFKEKAELETTSNARIKAMIGAEEVNADINGTLRDVKTKDVLRKLEFWKNYSLELSYMYAEDRFEGSCSFTVDWKGVKEFTVNMRRSVDILLDKAYKLADDKAWNEVQLNCQRILELDKTNEEALKLKEMAIFELTSNLKIKAMIGTELVNADIGGLEHEVNSNGIIRNLEFGKEYTLNLSCMYLGDKYEGFYTFTTNWKGLKEMIVEMRKTVEILLEKAQNLVDKESWVEVQVVCKQILELNNNNEVAKRLNLDAEIALSSNPRLMAIPKSEIQPQKEKKVIQLGNKVNIQISNKQIIQMIKINNNMWMGKFEITQEQFEFIMGYNPSVIVNFQNPVESLSWEEANSFCNKLTLYCIKNDLISKDFHFALPNMHEWYKALKDTCTKEINSLKSTSDISVIIFYTNQICWLYDNSSGRHHIVGTKSSTGKNLYDLLGNVSEWCSNSYNESNNIRYCIGGNFNSTRSSIIESLTVENSGAWVNAKGGKHIGFRVVLVPTR